MSVIIFVMLMFIVFLIFGIVTQKKVVALQNKLIGSEILAIERERERLSSDLHDSLAPTLSAMILLSNMIETDHDPSIKIRNDLNSYLQKTSGQVREISRNIIPRFYEDATVSSVITKAIDDTKIICEENGIHVSSNIHADISFSKDEHLHLYRITQEILNNASKHSKATSVDIQCSIIKNNLVIIYHDNGVGFDPDKKYTGLGISNIQNRLNLLKGVYAINSSKKKGTEMYIHIPV